jgi:branched-subunit amino acid ABC-type transport system permease component
LTALGIVILLKAMDLINFAQGQFVMAGAFIGLGLVAGLKLPYGVAFILAVVLTGLLAIIIERLTYRPLKNAPLSNAVIATIAVFILLEELGLIFGGPEPLPFPSPMEGKSLALFGTRLMVEDILILAIAILLMFLLQIFFKRTYTGLAMKAVMQDREIAAVMGINVNRIVTFTFILAGALGGAAGFLIAPVVFVSFSMGSDISLRTFSAAAIGGWYSIPGTIVGGMLLGVLDNFTANFLTSAYRDVIIFSILILFLLFRPAGIFGKRW